MEGLSADKRFKDMADTILVAGGPGTVGSEVVKRFLGMSQTSILKQVFIHSKRQKRFNSMTDLKQCRLTMTNKNDLKQLLKT